ncbi:PIF1-like helicase-domain-containing protein [Obelidium mucronatum]|nr:PIF1-like helicase-domain-containing protein [Obelidium mucronatum]
MVKEKLPDGELNPGLARERGGYYLALGVAIMNKCLHIFLKIQPKKKSEAGVPTEPIERIGWLTGDNKNTKSAFHTAYFKEYPREVVQYSTGMWPHGNQDGEFIAPRFRAPEPSVALLAHFFPLWRVFEDKVKNPDDPIFRETVDEAEDHNEAIGLMDLDSDDELTAEVLEANAHHLKSGVVLAASFRTNSGPHSQCPIVSAAVTPDIVEAIKAGGGGVFDTDEWKDFYQNVFVEEEKYAAWKLQMSTAKRPNQHTATSPTATVVRLSDEQVASLQLGRLPQNLQDEISGLPDIIRQALEAALLPYKDQLHENTRALERVMATLISSDMDRNAPPADRAQSNLIANDDTQNIPRDAPQVEEPPPAAIPRFGIVQAQPPPVLQPVYSEAEGLCATYARPYSPSDCGKDNVPTVTFPVISSVGLAQATQILLGPGLCFCVLGSRHGTAIFGNTAKQKQFMNYNRVGWFVLDKAQLTLEQQTIHAFAGCGLGEEHAYDMIKNISEAAKKRWRKVKVLILDEVSMVNGQFFDDLHSVAASLRTEHGLFGGIQLIVCGGFLQLPPVVKPPKLAQFAFESGVWSSLFKDGVVAIYHQSETDFIDALNEILYGANVILSKTETLMRSCSRELACPDGLKPTQLDEVDRCNLGHLEALSGNTFGFFAKLTGNAVKLRELVGRVLAPEQLKVGAQVMLVKNLGDGLANGSIGTVNDVSIDDRKVTVKFAAVGSTPAITTTLEPEVWSFTDTFTGI